MRLLVVVLPQWEEKNGTAALSLLSIVSFCPVVKAALCNLN